jgi:death on curing protein
VTRRISPAEVLALHDRIVTRTGGRPGVRDLGGLVSALTRPFGGTGSGDFYPTIEEKAAALCHGLVREHPFDDGNHRTGVTAAALFLQLNGLPLSATPSELVGFAKGVAGEHHRIDEMAKWFRTHSQPDRTRSARPATQNTRAR